MIRRFLRHLFLFAALSLPAAAETRSPSLTDLAARLTEVPPSQPGEKEGLVQGIWYEGEPLAGKKTRVFAWLGRPAGAEVSAKAPAMLLVHGGGGMAFKDWAKHWAERGYVSLAMDTSGQGPDGKRHADAGPDQSDSSKFREFTDTEIPEMWTWHAIGAVIRGHALLNSLPEVDRSRVGITGISWGGYLTCLTAGIDPELKVAVPVYGCGFLGENSYWRDRTLAALKPETRSRWLAAFDPAVTVGKTACPILFLNGSHDFAYPPDSYRKTFGLAKPELRTISLRVDLPHGHIWTFGEVDAFVDCVMKPGAKHPPLVRLGDPVVAGPRLQAPILPGTLPASAELHYTTMTGAWQQRQWKTAAAEVAGQSVSAPLPAERPLTLLFTVKDARGLITGSSFLEIGTGENTACIPRDKLEEDFYDWHRRHAAVLKLRDSGNPDIILIGDSITHLWGGEPAEPRGGRGADSWQDLFGTRRVFNLGFGWDRTQNVLWRIGNGELEGLRPKTIVIHIGTNNLAGTSQARENTPAEIAEGIGAIVECAKAKCPGAKIILMAVMPRGRTPDDPARTKVAAINALLPDVAKTSGATLLDITPRLLEADGSISKETMPDALHPGARGYRIWAEALKSQL